uniref:Glycine-rich protein DOT1-like n=1 Tax=Elaeis guineensis var. tenera TaxID=51953 RepID=A0A6I9QDL1_ELAGV|nr:glycine-rich protein DOT1-like [Elaeis guineensis]
MDPIMEAVLWHGSSAAAWRWCYMVGEEGGRGRRGEEGGRKNKGRLAGGSGSQPGGGGSGAQGGSRGLGEVAGGGGQGFGEVRSSSTARKNGDRRQGKEGDVGGGEGEGGGGSDLTRGGTEKEKGDQAAGRRLWEIAR